MRIFFEDCSAQCIARLLGKELSLVEMQAAVNELRTVQNLLTRFELAQQNLVAQARAISQRKRELDEEAMMEYQRQADERGRRAARPIG